MRHERRIRPVVGGIKPVVAQAKERKQQQRSDEAREKNAARRLPVAELDARPDRLVEEVPQMGGQPNRTPKVVVAHADPVSDLVPHVTNSLELVRENSDPSPEQEFWRIALNRDRPG